MAWQRAVSTFVYRIREFLQALSWRGKVYSSFGGVPRHPGAQSHRQVRIQGHLPYTRDHRRMLVATLAYGLCTSGRAEAIAGADKNLHLLHVFRKCLHSLNQAKVCRIAQSG